MNSISGFLSKVWSDRAKLPFFILILIFFEKTIELPQNNVTKNGQPFYAVHLI